MIEKQVCSTAYITIWMSCNVAPHWMWYSTQATLPNGHTQGAGRDDITTRQTHTVAAESTRSARWNLCSDWQRSVLGGLPGTAFTQVAQLWSFFFNLFIFINWSFDQSYQLWKSSDVRRTISGKKGEKNLNWAACVFGWLYYQGIFSREQHSEHRRWNIKAHPWKY